MTEEKSPDNDVLKIEVDDEIPVEDETVASKAERTQTDLVEELSRLGRQFGETMNAAWNSEERQNFEREVKEGVQLFAKEIDKAFHEVKKSPAAQRAKSEASEFKTKVNEADLGQKTQSSIAQGLRWMSSELGKLAEQFTPSGKEPDTESSDIPEGKA